MRKPNLALFRFGFLPFCLLLTLFTNILFFLQPFPTFYYKPQSQMPTQSKNANACESWQSSKPVLFLGPNPLSMLGTVTKTSLTSIGIFLLGLHLWLRFLPLRRRALSLMARRMRNYQVGWQVSAEKDWPMNYVVSLSSRGRWLRIAPCCAAMASVILLLITPFLVS